MDAWYPVRISKFYAQPEICFVDFKELHYDWRHGEANISTNCLGVGPSKGWRLYLTHTAVWSCTYVSISETVVKPRFLQSKIFFNKLNFTNVWLWKYPSNATYFLHAIFTEDQDHPHNDKNTDYVVIKQAPMQTTDYEGRVVVDFCSSTCAIHSLMFTSNLKFSTLWMAIFLPMLLFSVTSQCCNSSICDVTMGHTMGTYFKWKGTVCVPLMAILTPSWHGTTFIVYIPDIQGFVMHPCVTEKLRILW